MFIVFEGGDGSGKSTQSKILVESLKAKYPDRDVIWTREPGGTPGAEEIRALLLGGDKDRWSPDTEILLFNAARRDHVEKVIQPALDAGKIVICDRYVGSTIAYQGVRGEALAEKAKRVHKEVIGLNPDITFILDRPAADASVAERGLDRMEEAQEAFKFKTRQQFADMMAKDPTWTGIFVEDKDLASAAIFKTVETALDGKFSRKVFMDEGYVRALNPLCYLGPKVEPRNLLANEVHTDMLSFGRNRDENPFYVAAVVKVEMDEDVADMKSITPVVNGIAVDFLDISREEAETLILERVEADLPELMAKYSGYTTEDPSPN